MDIPVIAIHKYPSPHEVYHQKSYNGIPSGDD